MIVPVLIALSVSVSSRLDILPAREAVALDPGGTAEPVREREADDPAALLTYTVGTTDTAGLAGWLARRGWSHRALGAGLFEVDIPSDSLDTLAARPGIDRIEAPARRSHHAVDASRDRINGDEAHAGIGLPRIHRGTKALVGIVDIGVDLNHLAFQDSMGNSRIVRVWDQTNTTGKPPSGFSAGTLFATPAAIKALGRTGSQATHGTHVAGLAAGRGWPAAGGNWWGVADDARIALVDCGDGCRLLNDGVKYLFKLADSLKLPVAVNMSWGTLNGPRNGKSSDCVLTKSLVGPGKIVVASAGNTGGNPAHGSRTLRGDTARFALQLSRGTQTLSNGTKRTAYFNDVEFWGDSGKTYQAWIEYLNAKDSLIATSQVFSVGSSSSTYQMIDNRKIAGSDTVWYKGNIEKRSGQGGLRLTVSTNRSGMQMRIGVTASTGTVHGWIWEDGLDFLKLDASRCRGCVVPDSFHIISDKATCPAVISVGAIQGGNGLRASFTSRGPGLGPVPKPDLAAPGVSIVSSLNSGWPGSGGVAGTLGGSPWGPMSGTSMSAPLVTGTVALLLEANPRLTTDSAIALLRGRQAVHNPDTGWARLDVQKLLKAQEEGGSTGLQPWGRAPTGASQVWIAADGRRIAVPAGARASDVQPSGLGWLQTCSAGKCTTRGMIRP